MGIGCAALVRRRPHRVAAIGVGASVRLVRFDRTIRIRQPSTAAYRVHHGFWVG
jgi:hypothetical protein